MAKKPKTNKAARKRFKITGSGKVFHKTQADNSHLKVNKNRAQKARRSKKSFLASKKQMRKIKAII